MIAGLGLGDNNDNDYSIGQEVSFLNSGLQARLGETEPGQTKAFADLSAATSATINDIRQAFQIQKLYERDARGGTRYTEIVRSHFGVTSPDARLQRPEYLGGSTTPMNITAVPTMYGDGTVPQGELAGYGVVSGSNGHGFTKSFTEHCVIIGLVSVPCPISTIKRASTSNGCAALVGTTTGPHSLIWENKSCKIKNSMPTAQQTTSSPGGYQERYAEYRYKPSIITSTLRSTAAAPLDSWHLAQFFGNSRTWGHLHTGYSSDRARNRGRNGTPCHTRLLLQL